MKTSTRAKFQSSGAKLVKHTEQESIRTNSSYDKRNMNSNKAVASNYDVLSGNLQVCRNVGHDQERGTFVSHATC